VVLGYRSPSSPAAISKYSRAAACTNSSALRHSDTPVTNLPPGGLATYYGLVGVSSRSTLGHARIATHQVACGLDAAGQVWLPDQRVVITFY
jgi:hypothetical protein